MGGTMARVRRVAVTAALALMLLVLVLPGEASSLPEQSSPVGREHAHTHGPDGLELYRPRGQAPAAAYEVDATASWAASQYDGQVFAADQPDLTKLPTVHFVYVHPSDQPSRFATYAAMLQADARDASALLTTLYGRGIRLDERSRTDRRKGTFVDITVVQSTHTAARLAGTDQFSLVADELWARGFTNPNKKYAAWLDAGSRYCGQGELWGDDRRKPDNANERRTTAIVYRPYDPTNADGGFCRGRTLRHELGHNLGALQAAAPNEFDGAHCDDSAEDTMCYTSVATTDTGGPAFDFGNDDYWDPVANPALRSTAKLGWWTVNLSKYVCPKAGCRAASTPEY